MRRLLTAVLLVLLTVVARPAQAAEPGSVNDRLVVAWYVDFLGREPAAAAADPGRSYWVDRLDAGERREDVLRGITRSAEQAEVTVEAIYGSHLGRSADPGAGVWVDGLQRGMAPEWVEQNVLASDEFTRTYSRRSNAWFPPVLGRAARSYETLYWQGQLSRNGSLATLRELWYTPEAIDVRIDDAYAFLLARPADADAAYWRGPMAASELETLISLASTAEYAGITS